MKSHIIVTNLKSYLKTMDDHALKNTVVVFNDRCPEQESHEYALREIHPTLITWGY